MEKTFVSIYLLVFIFIFFIGHCMLQGAKVLADQWLCMQYLNREW